MKYDILIKNGKVIDPRSNLSEICDIGIYAGRITPTPTVGAEAETVVDATGCLVLPGLIDFHAHIAYKGGEFAINPDLMLSTGVTAMVDAGSCGYANYEQFHNSVVDKSDLRIKAYLNMDPIGIYEFGKHPDYSFKQFNERRLRELGDKYGDEILGYKIMYSQESIGDMGLWPLQKTLELSERYGVGVCVHTTGQSCEAEDVASLLRRGDIYCHCYQNLGNNILDADGNIKEKVLEARCRGVLFDAANGRMHLNFPTARAALLKGFKPDIISSDLVSRAMFLSNCNKTLPWVMAKYLYLGMSITDVVRAVTEIPAVAMGMDGLIGTLAPGAYGDVSIFKLEERAFSYNVPIEAADPLDCDSKPVFISQMTVLNGKVAYCAPDFNLA